LDTLKFFPLTLVVALLVIFFPWHSLLLAAEIDFRSQTIMRGFERDIESGEKKFILPVYEYLGIDYGDPEAGGLSVHLYGWGRKDMTSSTYFEDDPDGDLVYGYLQYAKPFSRLRINMGRQHIFSGVTNESVDGLQVETGLGPYFSASLYGGLPTADGADDGGSGDSIYGGRLAHRLGSSYEIGLSYQNVTTNGALDASKAGADLVIQVGAWLTLNGLSSYNLESGDWREHNYSARLQLDHWALEPSYQYFQYQDYFNTNNENNTIFAFLKESDETLAMAGADLLWQGAGAVEMGVRGRSYTYNVRQESAQYVAGLLNIHFTGGSQIGAEVGKMDGQTPENIYGLYRGYFYWQNPFKLAASGFVSGDALYVAYDAPVYGQDSSVHYTLGAGRTFLNNRIETKLSVIYSQDPYFESDFGGVMTFQIDY
jgi:hypothetical protein